MWVPAHHGAVLVGSVTGQQKATHVRSLVGPSPSPRRRQPRPPLGSTRLEALVPSHYSRATTRSSSLRAGPFKPLSGLQDIPVRLERRAESFASPRDEA